MPALNFAVTACLAVLEFFRNRPQNTSLH